jgi:hypothetical protein
MAWLSAWKAYSRVAKTRIGKRQPGRVAAASRTSAKREVEGGEVAEVVLVEAVEGRDRLAERVRREHHPAAESQLQEAEPSEQEAQATFGHRCARYCAQVSQPSACSGVVFRPSARAWSRRPTIGSGNKRMRPGQRSSSSRTVRISGPPKSGRDRAVHLPARRRSAQASEFWERMAELVAEFEQLPRSGRPCTDSRSASIPPTSRRYRAPEGRTAQKPLGAACRCPPQAPLHRAIAAGSARATLSLKAF